MLHDVDMLSYSNMENFNSMYSYNKSSQGASVGRIIVTDAKIIYRNREYSSASAALFDYISEFHGKSEKEKYVREVNDLLTPDSPLRMTAERSLSMGIRHTSEELRLHDAKMAIGDSYNKMKQVDEIFEVADILDKSSNLLKKIDDDRLSNVNDVRSDIGSMATETLLNVNPYPAIPVRSGSNLAIPVSGSSASSQDILVEPRKGHIYSYRLPRSRSRTATGVTFQANSSLAPSSHSRDERISRLPGKSTFLSDSVVDQCAREVKDRSRFRHQSLDASSRSRLPHGFLPSDTRFQRHRMRSRSESPIFKSSLSDVLNKHRTPCLVGDTEPCVRCRNNVQGMSLPRFHNVEITGNTRHCGQGREGGRRAPSWIEEIAGSDTSSVATSDLNLYPACKTTVKSSNSSQLSSPNNSKTDGTESSFQPLGLNFSDLAPPRESFKCDNARKNCHIENDNTSTPIHQSRRLPVMRKNWNQVNDLKPVRGLSEPFEMSDSSTGSFNRTKHRQINSFVSKPGNVATTSDNKDLRQKDTMYDELKSSSDKERRKIDTMLKELDQLRSKLSTFNGDSQSSVVDVPNLCLQDGGGVVTASADGPGFGSLLEKDELLCPSVDTEGLAELSSIKDVHYGNRSLSMAQPQRPESPSPSLSADLLNGDRSWEKLPLTSKPREDFLDSLADGNEKTTLSGGHQPGSIEALKNMLFKLQSEASDGHEVISPGLELSQANLLQPSVSRRQDGLVDSMGGIASALADYNFEAEPGGQSLERALVHLSRLKSLVKSNEGSLQRKSTAEPSDRTETNAS